MTCWGIVQGSYCFTDLFVIRDGYESYNSESYLLEAGRRMDGSVELEIVNS